VNKVKTTPKKATGKAMAKALIAEKKPVVANHLAKIQWMGGRAKFNYLNGINRGITPAQVTKLAESVTKMGVIRPVIVADLDFITGRKETYIIDGQHLFNALLRLDQKVPYISVEIKNKEELVETIAMLNASSKSWTLLDYVVAWGSLKSDYVKLNKLFETYDFELGIIAGIMSNRGDANESVLRSIKRGTFKIVDESANMQIMKDLTDLFNVIPRMNRFENRYVCSEFVKFVRSKGSRYHHETFIKNVKKNRDKFIAATQEEGYLISLFETCNK
jgi:hypothetical protein